MENDNKIYKGIVVRDFRFVSNTNPYGFIHPEHEKEFELLKTKSTRELANYINYINDSKKEENIQFILRCCKDKKAQEFTHCDKDDNVKRGDLVTFTYHICNNGFPQARDIRLVKAYGAGQTPFYAEPTLKETTKDLVKGTSVENAVGILIDEFEEEFDDEEKEYSEEDLDLLDDQDNY